MGLMAMPETPPGDQVLDDAFLVADAIGGHADIDVDVEIFGGGFATFVGDVPEGGDAVGDEGDAGFFVGFLGAVAAASATGEGQREREDDEERDERSKHG